MLCASLAFHRHSGEIRQSERIAGRLKALLMSPRRLNCIALSPYTSKVGKFYSFFNSWKGILIKLMKHIFQPAAAIISTMEVMFYLLCVCLQLHAKTNGWVCMKIFTRGGSWPDLDHIWIQQFFFKDTFRNFVFPSPISLPNGQKVPSICHWLDAQGLAYFAWWLDGFRHRNSVTEFRKHRWRLVCFCTKITCLVFKVSSRNVWNPVSWMKVLRLFLCSDPNLRPYLHFYL